VLRFHLRTVRVPDLDLDCPSLVLLTEAIQKRTPLLPINIPRRHPLLSFSVQSRSSLPPSTISAAPCTSVTYSEARKAMSAAMSTGDPTADRSIASTPDLTLGLSQSIG